MMRQHGELSIPSAPSMEMLGSPCKTPQRQNLQLLLVFPSVHGDVQVVVQHSAPVFLPGLSSLCANN